MFSRVASVIACAILLTGCSAAASTGTPSTLTSATSEVVAPGLLVVPKSERPQAPALRGETFDGTSVELADFRGSVVLVNAYASWCPPCMEELPILAQADRELPHFAVLGLDVNDSPVAGQGVLDAVGADYPAIIDREGDLLAEFSGSPSRGLPFSVLVDQEGRVAGRIIGPATRAMLADALLRIAN